MEHQLGYQFHSAIYALSWSQRRDPTHPHLAAASFREGMENTLSFLTLTNGGQGTHIQHHTDLKITYPPTQLQWAPQTSTSSRDMIAATTDKVRFYQENEDGSISHAFDLPPAAPDAKSGKGSEEEMNCPLTSMDWCDSDPNVIATSCLDATCTIWDLNEQRAQARIIAHSDEVFDVCWFPGDRHVFSTIGKDGSVRIFDLRNLEHSTIIFESDQYQPLCRLRWNKQDTNYLATFSMGTNTVSVLDLRMPGKAFCSLSSHSQPVTAIAWSPVARHQLCSTSEDHSCLVWNISYPTSTDEPAQASPTHEWTLGAPVQNVAWCANNSNLIAAGVENQLMIINI